MVLLSTSKSNDEGIPVYARSRWRIPVEVGVPIQNTVLMRIRAKELLDQRGANTTIRSISNHPYNCVGLIFASRRAWIEIDHIRKLFSEDGYRRVQSADAAVGDVVLYAYRSEPSHVALITQIDRFGSTPNIRVISKWGLEAEFEHMVDDVPPQLGTPQEYWTDRVV